MDQRANPPASSSSTPSFWERCGLAAGRAGVDAEPACSYSSFVNIQCRLEEEQGGRPARRKCERLIRRFRDCGRGKEEIESTVEEIIDHNYRPGSSLDGFLREGGSGQQQLRGAPLNANVGEALEEFVEYAEQIKRKAVGGTPPSNRSCLGEPRGGVMLDEAYARRQTPESPPPGLSYSEPWYARLFHRRAQCSPGRQRPWQDFQEDFQEV